MKITPRRLTRSGLPLGLLLGLAICVGLVGAAPPAQGGTIHYDESVQGTISDSSDEQPWRFQGRSGDLILIDMRADNSDMLDTYLTLLDPGGGVLASDDDGGEGFNSRLGPLPLPTDGEYTILAGRYSGTGGYTLELTSMTGLPALRPGKPLAGTLNYEDPTDYFLIEATPATDGQLLRLETRYTSGSSAPLLALYGPQGLIANTEIDSAGFGVIDPVVPLAGETYVIVVTGDSGGTTGPYEIGLTLSEVELMTPGEPQTGTLNYDIFSLRHYLRHYYRAETEQAVRVTVTTEDPIAPALQVTDLARQTWLFSGEGEHVRETSLVLLIPRGGLYVIEVHDGSYRGEGGTYTITLENVTD